MVNIREYMKSRNLTTVQKTEEKKPDGYLKKLWLHRTKKGVLVFLAAAALATVFLGFRIYKSNTVYTEYDVLAVSELTEVSGGVFLPFGDYILRYTMDGISCMDKNGGLVWGQAYEIKNPIVDICDNYVAVASQKGNNVYIFNKAGYQGEVLTQYPIMDVKVAGQGVVAVIMEDAGNNYIKLYDTAGTELVTMKRALEGEGFPLAVAISKDGKKLAVSTLDISGSTIKNSLEFFNFSEVGQNYVEQLVGVYQEELGGALVPHVAFTGNEKVCAFGDNQLFIINMKEIPELATAIPVEGEIHSVFYDEKHIGIVTYSDEEDSLYTLKVYTADGKELPGISGKKLSEDYKDISFAGENILLYNDYTCEIITLSGSVKFQYTFDKNIVMIKHIADTRYALVSASSISEIRLK